MSGTKEGALKAAARNEAREPGFYARIGAIGGSRPSSGGFASRKRDKNGLTGPERARIAGRKGGLKSRRGPVRITNGGEHEEIEV